MTVTVWILPLLVPLAAAGAQLVSLPGRRWLPAAAPLPALALGLAGPPADPLVLDWLLLGTRLDLDDTARALLVAAALLWSAAGAAAASGPGRDRGFAASFLVAMTGNLGLLLAADAVSFYVLFALMTFAAYALVVHDRSAGALRAGRVTIALAVVGEVSVFTALTVAVHAAGTTELAALGPAVAGSPQRDLVVAAALLGFAVKAGVVPLHVWLPLAHPAAPVAASAVLSGAMIKAGLVGWIRVLPVGEAALGSWATLVVVAGLVSAFGGVAVGLTQTDAKANLAYSSISQMGVMVVLAGVALAEPDTAPLAVAGIAVYAVHHGFAKGALFLGVGALRAGASAAGRRWLLAGTALAAVSLAGLPLTSGALAKLSVKDAVGALPGSTADLVALALSLSAAGTTVLMARLLGLVARRPEGPTPRPPHPAPLAPFAVVTAAVVGASWVLPGALLAVDLPTLAPGVVWDGLWPVLLGSGVAGAAWAVHRRTGVTLPALPPGDVVVVVEGVVGAAGRWWDGVVSPSAAAVAARVRTARDAAYRSMQPGGGFDRVDRRLAAWSTLGIAFATVATAVTTLLVVGG